MIKRICVAFSLLITLLPAGDARGAQVTVFGLESIRIEQVFDPNARPERLLLVSGSLKLVGGYPGGNAWHSVSHIPQRAAAPKSDYGIFQAAGDRMLFYSFVSFSSYTGTVSDNGERIVIRKINRGGQSQTEVWYLVRRH